MPATTHGKQRKGPADPHPPERTAGFSLLELLVAIAVILIMAGLVLASSARVKDWSRGATCVSNLRQVSLAMLVYAEDHGGQVPSLVFEKEADMEIPVGTAPGKGVGKGQWKIKLHPQKKFNTVVGTWLDRRLVRCPSDPEPEMISVLEKDGTVSQVPFSYNVNFEFLVSNGRIHELAAPQEVLLLYDGAPSRAAGKYLISKYNSHYASFRHRGKVAGAYADGHIGQLQVIQPSDILLE